MTRTPLAKEKDVQRLILDWLNAKGIWNMRLNTGAMGGSHNGKRWFVRFGKPGMADVLAVTQRKWIQQSCGCCSEEREPEMLWIEIKSPTGKQSPEQKAFQAEVEAQGMKYILARSLDDVTAVLA